MDWTPPPPPPPPALAGEATHGGAAALGEDEDEGELAHASRKRRRTTRTPRRARARRLTPLQLEQAVTLRNSYPGRAVPPEAVEQLARTLRVEASVLQAWFAGKEGVRTRTQAKLNAELRAAPVPTPREAVTACAECGALRVVSEALLKGKRVRVRCCGVVGADGAPLVCGTPSEFADAAAAAAWTAAKAAERAAAVLALPGRHPRGSKALAAAAERPLPKHLHQTAAFRKLAADLKSFYFDEDNGGAALPAGGADGDDDDDEAAEDAEAAEDEEEDEDEDEEEEEEEAEEEADENAPPARRSGVQPKAKAKGKRASFRWTAAKNHAVVAASEAMGLFAAHTTGASVCAAMVRDGTLPAGMTAQRAAKLLENHRDTVGCVRCFVGCLDVRVCVRAHTHTPI
jgi:hypothetical protein